MDRGAGRLTGDAGRGNGALLSVLAFRIFYLVLMLFLTGCAAQIERIPPVAVPSLVLVPDSAVPSFVDDLNDTLLETAVESSLQYYGKLPAGSSFRIGDNLYTLEEMKESLRAFLQIIRSPAPPDVRDEKIRAAFDIYKSTGNDGKGTVLFTGYFEPVMAGSLERTERYKYPLYRVPEETVVVNLGRFREKYKYERLVGRVKNGELIPHYSRAEIEGDRILEGRNLEIVWVDDPVDLFFLHIQGSGKIRLPDGAILQVSYAQSNGRPYRSVAHYLLNSGKVSEKEMSHQSIKKYLKEHPVESADALNYNESYVFFRVTDGPIGSLGFPVISGRSIATDPAVFPRGALAFISARKPVFDEAGTIITWGAFSRFVLSQDAGGAIKGPGRIDLFCGTGDTAELLAGSLKEKGELYFLVGKR
ncbi:MAG: MltA domain-containing protein [Deltaproteobacteria bacterium]|nr:MltA domain-containing protein [Deltaproteobacteria bacterium]